MNQTNTASYACHDARPFLKPGWYPANILLMVLGFVFFWPLGLAMLAYNIWGHRLTDLKKDLKRQFNVQTEWAKGPTVRPTGNAAFDTYRDAELKRLEEERAKLDAMREEFDEYMDNLRKARDQEEFDRFMSGRKNGRDNGVIDV